MVNGDRPESPVSREGAQGGALAVQLEEIIESFFPFDPYHEHLSIKAHLGHLFMAWPRATDVDEDDDV